MSIAFNIAVTSASTNILMVITANLGFGAIYGGTRPVEAEERIGKNPKHFDALMAD